MWLLTRNFFGFCLLYYRPLRFMMSRYLFDIVKLSINISYIDNSILSRGSPRLTNNEVLLYYELLFICLYFWIVFSLVFGLLYWSWIMKPWHRWKTSHTYFGYPGFIAPKHLPIICLSNLSILNVPDEGYSRNASCALNVISTFLLR